MDGVDFVKLTADPLMSEKSGGDAIRLFGNALERTHLRGRSSEDAVQGTLPADE